MKNYKMISVGFIVLCQVHFSTSSLAAKYSQKEKNTQNTLIENPTGLVGITDTQGVGGDVLPGFLVKQATEFKKNSFQLISNLIRQKNFQLAKDRIDILIREIPDDPQLYNLQALLNINKGNKDSALQSYQKVLELDANNVYAYLGIANLAIADGNLKKAKNNLDQALVIDRLNTTAYLLLADIAIKQADKEKAERILIDAHKSVQGNIVAEIQIINTLGRLYMVQKQPAKALILSQSVAERHPGNPDVLSVLAGALIANNQKNQAIETLENIIELDKVDVEHRIILARLLSEDSKQKKKVLKLFDDAFRYNSANPKALVLKTVFFIQLKRYSQALAEAKKINKLFPEIGIGDKLKGDTYLAKSNLPRALKAYQRAYEIEPNLKVLLLMADILTVQKKQEAAIDLLERESKVKNYKAISLKLAVLYQQAGDLKLAEEYYDIVIKGQPDNVVALNNLASIYMQQNNPKAIVLAERAYRKAAKYATIADTYGYILIKQGRVEDGLKILQEAANAEPNNSDIQFHLAEAYGLSGDKQKAISMLKALRKGGGDFSEKKKAEQLLTKLQSEG